MNTLRISYAAALFILLCSDSVLGQWTQIDKLLADDGAAWDGFGFSVSTSGETIVVGAWGSPGGDPNYVGSAYVFQQDDTNWVQVAKLLASDGAPGDNFGWSVSISGDTVVVGALSDDDSGDDSGSAYVFVKPIGGWSGMISEDAKLLASDAAMGGGFGTSVTSSADTVVVAAWGGWGGGAAYVFERPSGGWTGTFTEDAKLVASDSDPNQLLPFFDVSISGDTVVAGSPYDDDSAFWAGSAYVFERPIVGWAGTLTEDAKLLASDADPNDFFGADVSISDDTIAIGAPGEVDDPARAGRAYVFEKPIGGWTGTLNENAKLLARDADPSDHFGAPVSISGDTVVVGAGVNEDNGDFFGSAYVFERPVGGWTGTLNEDALLTPSDGEPNDRFGRSVSISGDMVVVGAPYDDDNGTDSGSAYVFILSPLGDLDGDGDVDFDDLNILLASYAIDAGGDLDSDGDTDFEDLNILLANYES